MKTKKGAILYLTLILLSLLVLMSLSLSQIVVLQSKVSQNIGKSVIAYYAAETGIEKGWYEYYVHYQNPPFSTSSVIYNLGANPVQYSLDFYATSSHPNSLCPGDIYSLVCIYSQGKFLDVQRVVSTNY